MSSSELLTPAPLPVASAVRFGPFHYDPARREISDARGPLRIGSRALQLLDVLLEQPGRLYSREELVARVWPRTVVEETSLRVHISALRKLLGDGVDGARYITNVPGRGYAFVGEVQPAPPREADTPDRWRASGMPGASGASGAAGAAGTSGTSGASATIGMPGGWPGLAALTGTVDADATDAAASALVRRPGHAPTAAPLPDLPARLTRPIGREHVIAQIGELLARERLVSVVGAGGMGKTTVALAVAEGLRPRYVHGACLVDLSRLSDPALVAVELGQTQGVIVSPGDPPGLLETALRGRQVLFVLDNCEHVIDAVATLVDRLMRVCPGLLFLATSREPLEIEAEWVFKLPPLALPGPDEALDTEDLLAYPAIQLFVERAQATSDAFVLTEAHAPAVRQLCGFLDGIPLAIELAAARVDSLGVLGLLRRLESAFELLTRGRRTALSRHRTLQAVMDWSYDLLSDSERRVLQRLSVFRGAFDLDGAVTVAAGDDLNRRRVIEDVLSLCAKSLIVLDTSTDDLLLHRLLYITRLYAEKHLANSAEAHEVHRRHATFIADGLLRARDAGAGMSQYHWSPALGSSFADVRAAIEWTLVEEHDLALGVRLTADAKRTYADVGVVEEYTRHLETALAKVGRAGPDPALLELPLRVAAGFMLGYAPDGDEQATALFSRTRELLQTQGSDDQRIEALFGMSTTSYGLGNYHRSLAACEEIRGLAVGRFEPLAVAISDRVSALCLHALGHHDAAEPLALRVIAFNGARVGRQFLSEVPFGVSMRIQLARIHWLRGHFASAWALLEEALAGSTDAHVFARGQVLGTAAVPMALWRGDTALAAQWTEELRDLSERKRLAYWLGHAQAFRCVIEGEPIPPGSATALAMTHCAPLGDLMATLHAARPTASTQARVEQGAVGWCAPEVLRRIALDEWRDDPDAARQRLAQAMRLAEQQGARFWMLRIALTQAAIEADSRASSRATAPAEADGDAPLASPGHGVSPALARVSQLLSCLDDGSGLPELVAARALLKDRA